MCKWGTTTMINVIRRNHDDYPDGKHQVGVDACIADYVQAMNDAGIITIGCCCGHGKAQAIVLVAAESAAKLTENGYEFVFKDYSYKEEDGTPYSTRVIEHYVPDSGKVEPILK